MSQKNRYSGSRSCIGNTLVSNSLFFVGLLLASDDFAGDSVEEFDRDHQAAQSGSGQDCGAQAKEFVCAKQIAVGFSDFTKEDGKCEASAPCCQRAGVNQCRRTSDTKCIFRRKGSVLLWFGFGV